MFKLFLAYLFLFVSPSFSQDGVSSNQQRFGSEQPKNRYEDAKKVVEQAKDPNHPIGQGIAKDFSSKGGQFQGKAFAENPNKYFNAWQATRAADEVVMQGGLGKHGMDLMANTCAEWTELHALKQLCGLDVALYVLLNFGKIYHSCQEGFHDGRGTAGQQAWEYFRGENVYEANNFGVSEIFEQTAMHPLLATNKELTLLFGAGSKSGGPPALSALLAKGGNEPLQKLKSPPHIGQSHFEGSGALPFEGQYNQFEVHVVRSRHDSVRANDYIKGDPYSYLRECMPPEKDQDVANAMFFKQKRFAIGYSEKIADLWRLPELSRVRYNGASAPYQQLYGNLYSLALKAGQEYYGTSMSPQLSFGQPSALAPKVSASLETSHLCASYWLADKGRWSALYGRFGDTDFPLDKTFNQKIKPAIQSKEDWMRLCYHPGLGSLYPLVGSVPTDSNILAPLMAIRRYMDWASWENIDGNQRQGGEHVDIETNYMDDFPGAVIYKNTYNIPLVGAGREDKLQRLNPAPTPQVCFTMKDVHPRNPYFDPKILKPYAQFAGSWRYAHWNRRRSCLCSKGLMWQSIPFFSPLIPFTNVCIPWEE